MFTSIFRISFIISTLLISLGGQQLIAKEKVQKAYAQSDEEAFVVRRIAEFWKDGDFQIVKTQIIDFLNKYPKSELKDYFLGILGDIFLQENAYEEALSNYKQIHDYSIIEKTILNKLQCYYELDHYQDLAKEGRSFVSSNSQAIENRQQELHFLMGEALFRQALQETETSTKKALAQEAKPYYQHLAESQYKETCDFALAEIAVISEEYESAAAAYLALAENHPNMKEDLLFQVATLQSRFNKIEASETFRTVKEMKGNHAKQAAFNLIMILFQNGNYQEVTQTYEKISSQVPEEVQPTFNFIVGKSFFSLGDYEKAYPYMQHYIDSTNASSDQLKNALLIQMTCAHQMNDEPLFETAFKKLDALFPEDQEIPKALFMHAMILKEQGAIAQADEKLKLIKEQHEDFEEQEIFLFEYGLLSHQNERWNDSYTAFKSYVTQFPDSPRLDAAWKLFLSSSLNLYKQSNEEENAYNKSLFFTDLQATLTHTEFLNAEEMKDYALLYAKTAYELNYYSDALRTLQDQIFTQLTEENDSLVLAEAHFIAGLCHAELQSDNSAFCMHLEQAIALNPDLYNSATTHLQLYNAYISLAGFGESGAVPTVSEHQKESINHAAQHLQEAYDLGNISIMQENRLWIANHYYHKVNDHFEGTWSLQTTTHPDVTVALNRASNHYQDLLSSEKGLLELTAQNLHFEYEVLKWAKLLGYQEAHQQKLALLKNLIEQQSEKPELNWASKKQVLFELANAYNSLGEKEKACETYAFIHASSGHFPTTLASSAAFKAARLRFELIDDKLRSEANPEILAVLNDLKELQIRKNAASEPLHLEAALEYAKIRSLVSEAEERDSRYLFFLNRIQDDFNSQEDLVTQDYLVNINKNEEKKQILDSYMKFINAEKIRVEAKHMHHQERLVEMEELHENALNLYNDIKNDPNTPRDLHSRITLSIQKINAMNAY